MRARHWPLIVGCVALLVGGFFWTKKVLHNREIASMRQLGPVAPGTDATHAVEPNDATLNAVDPKATEPTAAARSSSDKSASQTAPNSQINSSHEESNAARPPLTDEQLAELMDRHDCKNVPRTPARLASDLEYFELASEKWSDAMLAAYQINLTSAPTGAAKANSIHTVSALMHRCIKFDELLAAKPEGAPDLPKIDWSEYPEWATKVEVYDAKQVEKLIAAGQVKFLVQRARQNLENFTKLPGALGDLAYRDFRALQILGVPFSSGDQAGLTLLQQLLRIEIIDRAELDARQLVQQIKSARTR